jgi:hypothetical protein
MTTSASSAVTDNASYTKYVLAQLECAGLRSRLMTCEIDTISTALRGRLIDVDAAIEWLSDLGALGLITAVSSAINSVSTA